MENRKQAILDALNAFVWQRPCLEFGNYGDWKAYKAEQRAITKDLSQYRELRRYVELRDSITADMILEAARSAYSGRLTFEESRLQNAGYYGLSEAAGAVFRVGYTTGQYWPTEYRRAACAVLASAIWDSLRQDMPEPTLHHNSETGETLQRYKGLRAGDWLRAAARREFGRGIANRWFN